MGSTCQKQPLEHISLKDLKALSQYSVKQGTTLSNEQATVLKSIFPSFHTDANVRSLYLSLEKTPSQQFIDDNFTLTGEKKRLSKLYNFQHNSLMSYFNGAVADYSFFQQQNLEMGYLSVVLYVFVKNVNLLGTVLETIKANVKGMYGFNFFCNGQKQQVIVDDFIPIRGADSIKYSRIHKGVQVWPLMMEKAWCKLIGGYENALGLSPQCAFEQITGIPAYTFIDEIIPGNFQSFVTKCLNQKYWVCLVAKDNLPDIENRHVFYLESYDIRTGYKICSPVMTNYKLRVPIENVHRVNLTEKQLLGHFQYFIVGYPRDRYVPISIEVESAPRQSVWLKIVITDFEDVSIRFSQYYQGYLSLEQRERYKYSPVQIELYSSIGELVSNGCMRALGNSKSVYASQNVFEKLQGTYYLRISVEWLHPNVRKGNLVIYSRRQNVKTTILNRDQIKKTSELVYQQMVSDCPMNEIKTFDQCEAEVRSFETKGQTVIVIRNIHKRAHTMAIQFSEAQNIDVTNAVMKDRKVIIKFEAGESVRCLEISHFNYLQGMKIGKILLTKEQN